MCWAGRGRPLTATPDSRRLLVELLLKQGKQLANAKLTNLHLIYPPIAKQLQRSRLSLSWLRVSALRWSPLCRRRPTRGPLSTRTWWAFPSWRTRDQSRLSYQVQLSWFSSTTSRSRSNKRILIPWALKIFTTGPWTEAKGSSSSKRVALTGTPA